MVERKQALWTPSTAPVMAGSPFGADLRAGVGGLSRGLRAGPHRVRSPVVTELPPEGEAAAEERTARDVGGLTGRVVDELGRLDVADALAHEADDVHVSRDAA